MRVWQESHEIGGKQRKITKAANGKSDQKVPRDCAVMTNGVCYLSMWIRTRRGRKMA